jgi:hypothetical protein
MELHHHGVVPGFSYGRITYFYALPGLIDDYKPVSSDVIKKLPYNAWTPKAYLGSSGFRFEQAEKLITGNNRTRIEKGKLWAEGQIVTWTPLTSDETLTFNINGGKDIVNTDLGFTLEHCPDGGSITLSVNGKKVKLDGKDTLDLGTPWYTVLENHRSEKVALYPGVNKISLNMMNPGNGKKAGIDFVWLK